jgi:hypothetical protein
MKTLLTLQTLLKATSPITQEFLKDASCHICGSLKDTGIDKQFHVAFTKPFIWLVATFRNSFMKELAAS